MRTKTTTTIAAAALAALTLAGCGNEDTPTTGGSGGSGEASATASTGSGEPDTSDPRALADWTVVKLLNEQTTDICQYASDNVDLKFAKVGWCDTNPSFPETPTIVTLLGECAYTGSNMGIAGQLYYYEVEPTITFQWPSRETGDAVRVVVGADGMLADVLPTATMENDPTFVSGCAGGNHVSGATATIPLD